jgi:RecB family exonuclease
VRPRRLNVTEIQRLIRDPYAIYARHVLRLRPLDPLRPEPDARLSGTLIHAVLQRFVEEAQADPARLSPQALMALADTELERRAHWPGMRHVWRGRIAAFAPWFVETEAQRQAEGSPLLVEKLAEYAPPGTDFVLVGKPDRIDEKRDGTLEIYDYKTGSLPSSADIAHFDRQLMLLAMMAEAGAFPGTAGRHVARVAHIGLGRELKIAASLLEPGAATETAARLADLLTAYLDPEKGYPARRAQEGLRWDGDYDHLARYGEWAASDPAVPEAVG